MFGRTFRERWELGGEKGWQGERLAVDRWGQGRGWGGSEEQGARHSGEGPRRQEVRLMEWVGILFRRTLCAMPES